MGRFSVFPGQAFQTCPVLPGHEYDTLFTPVLSIVSVSSVFSVVVFVLELLGGGLDPLVDGFCAVGHFGYFFEYYCIVDGFVGVFSPGEGAVVFAEYCGYGFGVFVHGFEFIYDEVSGVFFVGLFDFFFGQATQAGYFAVNVVCMGGSIAGDSSSCLGPAGGIGGVGVDDSAYFRECFVKLYVGCGVGGGVPPS